MKAPHWRPAYVGLGSNLDVPEKQVRRAITALDDLPKTMLVCHSGLYRSAPLGPQEQPDFVNAVAGLLTQLDAHELLGKLRAMELAQGRKRGGERWGPRSIDLDLLACAGLVISEDGLELPHPGIAERNFVLLPWREIAPTYRVPGLKTIAELAAGISQKEPRIERIG